MNMRKSERQQLILELIADRSIARQDELAGVLRERGFEVTQASVSRDLDELGVLKVNGRYARPSLEPGASNPFGLRSLEPAGDNLLVVRCASGLASAAAVKIDAEGISEIVGTIAGDDTIFVAVSDKRAQRAVQKKLTSLLAR
jgi:transcriptional regulator of arginine metabolism